MLDHHLQRALVYRLALSPHLRFSELKPDDIENKLFTYHLKKVVSAGFVEKSDDGVYSLTAEGRRLGVHVLERTQALMDRAYSVLFLLVRRKSDGAWLLYRRKSEPLIDQVGFMHLTPTATESTIETAAIGLTQKTGLTAQFTVKANGYFRIYKQEELESFTHFTLLVADDAEGELVQHDEHAEYFWVSEIDLNDANLLQSMPALLECYQAAGTPFVEKIIRS